jgi:hypothetical protein
MLHLEMDKVRKESRNGQPELSAYRQCYLSGQSQR